MRASPEVEEPGDLIAADIRLRGEDGRFQRKPFHDSTAREIRQATRLLKEARRGVHAPSEDLKQRIDAVSAALPPVSGRLQVGGRVQFLQDKGVDYLTIRAIPVEALREHLELLLHPRH